MKKKLESTFKVYIEDTDLLHDCVSQRLHPDRHGIAPGFPGCAETKIDDGTAVRPLEQKVVGAKSSSRLTRIDATLHLRLQCFHFLVGIVLTVRTNEKIVGTDSHTHHQEKKHYALNLVHLLFLLV